MQRFKVRNDTDDSHNYDFSPATVAKKAKAAFLEWAGTTDIQHARERFSRCAALLADN